ncbi:MAG TPA: hypothetical protein VMW38_11770 [Terriglobia bacterium]|nr:hypothetical protein [Terriglobia bacterium]
MSKPMISLLHATAQPGTCEETARRWFERAYHSHAFPIEHVMACEYVSFPKCPHSPFITNQVLIVSGGSPVSGWNSAAEFSKGKILVMMADDLYPSEHWDREIMDAIPDPEAAAVLWVTTLDDHGKDLWPDIITHPVVTRAYLNRYGYFLHPAYYARFSDLEFSDKAKQDGVVIDRRGKIIWRHEDHQVPGNWHPTTSRINALHGMDNQTYIKRQAAGFPKEWAVWRP